MQAVLVMFRSSGERRSFSVTREITVLGRREDCDLMIPLGEVSRKHCRLVRDGDLLKIEDLGSANGTFLNGQRVQESLLAPGDTLQVGPVVFVLQIDGVPADDELQPVHAEGAMMAAGGAGATGSDADVHPGHPEEAMDDLEPLRNDDDEPMPMPTYQPAGEAPEAVEDLEPVEELEPVEDAAPAAAALPEELEPLDELEPVAPAEAAHDEPIPLDDLEPHGGEDAGDLGELEELAPEGSHDDGLGDLDLLDVDAEHEQKH